MEEEKLETYQKSYADIYRSVAEDSVAMEILDSLFASIYWDDNRLKDNHLGGYVNDFGHRYRRWHHRGQRNLSEDLSALEVDQIDLLSGVANYVEHPELHSKYLDWYCADTLTYVTCYQAIEDVQPYLVGFSGVMANASGGAWPWIARFWRFLWSGAKWIMWLAILFFVYEWLNDPEDLMAISAIVILTSLRQYQLRRGQSKIREMVSQMFIAYEALRSDMLSWDVYWRELNRTRELGVIWPGELYKLVEMKKG